MSTIQIVLLSAIIIILLSKVKTYFDSRTIQSFTPKQVANEIKVNKNIVLLDVRTQQENKNGSIKGSINIPLQDLEFRIHELQHFKDKTIVCYCQSGMRSLKASIKLSKLGFKVINMKGGYSSWQ